MMDLFKKFDKIVQDDLVAKYGDIVYDIVNQCYDMDQSFDKLCCSLEIYARLNISAEKVINEIIWKAGQDNELFNMLFIISDNKLYRLRDNLYFDNYPTMGSELNYYYPGQYTPEHLNYRISEISIDNLINARNTRLLWWMFQNNYEINQPDQYKIVKFSVQNGYLTILRYCIDHDYEFKHPDMCKFAAWNGHLDILKCLRKNKCPWNEETCEYAAAQGHIDILTWAHENGCPWDSRACAEAAKYNQLETLKWLRQKQCHWTDQVCAGAALHGYQELLEWAHYNGCPWDEKTFSNAAQNNNLAMLKWLRNNGCPWNDITFRYAAHHDNLEMIQWLHYNECPWDELTIATAAFFGHINIVKWMRENGCPWNSRACVHAALNNNLYMLKWLCANGCPLDSSVFYAAVHSSNINVMDWLYNHDCPMDATLYNAQIDQYTSDIETLDWLRDHNCLFGRYSCLYFSAIFHRNVNGLEWLIKNNHKCTRQQYHDILVEAIHTHNDEIIRLIISHKFDMIRWSPYLVCCSKYLTRWIWDPITKLFMKQKNN